MCDNDHEKTTVNNRSIEQGIINTSPHKFPPGHCGNPNGRPKGTRSFSTIIKDFLAMPADDFMNNIKEGQGKEFILLLKERGLIKDLKSLMGYTALIKQALAGKMQPFELILSQINEDKAKKVEVNTITEQTPLSDIDDDTLREIAAGRKSFADVVEPADGACGDDTPAESANESAIAVEQEPA